MQPSSLGEAIVPLLEAHGGKTAIRVGKDCYSYDALTAKTIAVATACRRLGVDRCLVVSRNTAACVATIYGSSLAGITPMLADPTWTRAEIEQIARENGADFVLGDPAALADWHAAKAHHVIGEDIAAIRLAPPGRIPVLHEECTLVRFTSGSSGTPRALQFSTRAVLAAARGWLAAACLEAGSRVLCCATLNNGLCFNTSLLPVFLAGGELSFHQGKMIPSQVLRTAAAIAPSTLVAFPALYDMIVAHPGDVRGPLSSLRQVISSAAPLPPAVREGWLSRVGLPIGNYYGLAEAGPVTFNDGSDEVGLGRPIAGVDIRLEPCETGCEAPAGAGRLLVRTASMAIDYLEVGRDRLADRLTEDGFYRTKDLAWIDAVGSLRLCGREDRVVALGGRKVDLDRIEAIISAIPGISAAHLDVENGRGGGVHLVATVEAGTMDRAQVFSACVPLLSADEMPSSIRIVDALRRSATGKVRRG